MEGLATCQIEKDLEAQIHDLEARLKGSATKKSKGKQAMKLGNAYAVRSEGSVQKILIDMISYFEAALPVLGSEEMWVPWGQLRSRYSRQENSDRLNGSRAENIVDTP